MRRKTSFLARVIGGDMYCHRKFRPLSNITKVWTIVRIPHFAPLGLIPLGYLCFYRHFAPLGLRLGASKFPFL